MVTVKNLTNSPYDLPTTTGFARLPAFGEVTDEFSGDYLQLLEASMAVSIISEPNNSPDADSDDLSKLRAEYKDLVGKRPFHKWDAAELQKRIDEALAS